MDRLTLHPDLTADQKMIVETVRDLAQDRLAGLAEEIDHSNEIPADVLTELADIGLFGLSLPEDRGGSGFDVVSHTQVLFELARMIPGLAAHLVFANTIPGSILSDLDHPTARDLGPKIHGASMSAGVAFSRDRRGVNCESSLLEVTEGSAGLVLNGSCRALITSARITHLLVEVTQHNQPALILVPLGAPGISTVLRPLLGMTGLCALDIEWSNHLISESAFLGRGEVVASALDRVQTRGRIAMAAIGAGIVRGALDHSLNYGAERRQFGVPIASFEALREKAAAAESVWMKSLTLAHAASGLFDSGRDATHLARVALLEAAESTMAATDDLLQIYGGYGYSREYPAERYYRDARALSVLLGGIDSLRLEIAAAIHSAWVETRRS